MKSDVSIEKVKHDHHEMALRLLSKPDRYIQKRMCSGIWNARNHADEIFKAVNSLVCEYITGSFLVNIKDSERELIMNMEHCVTGLQTEAGEIVDIFKKAIYYNRGVDEGIREMYLEESGDFRFYLAAFLNFTGIMFAEGGIKSFGFQKNTETLYVINSCLKNLDVFFGFTEKEILIHNMNKLEKGKNARYKNGYSDEAAKERADKKGEKE